jgi:hypothetical protein
MEFFFYINLMENIIFKVKDFKINNLKNLNIITNKYGDLIKYDKNRPLLIQSEFTKFDAFGFPTLDKYHTCEKDLHYFKAPLEEKKELYKFFTLLDNYFKDIIKDFEYVPLIKTYNNSSYVKFKIDDNTSFLKNNKPLPLNITKNKMSEIKKEIIFNSELRYIFHVKKIWKINNRCGLTIVLKAIDCKSEIEPFKIETLNFLD